MKGHFNSGPCFNCLREMLLVLPVVVTTLLTSPRLHVDYYIKLDEVAVLI